MTDGTLLKTLIELSQVDAALARMNAEQKQLETEISNQQIQLKKLSAEQQTKGATAKEKRIKVQREEKNLKEEQEKLVSRRKALGTLGNYKLQQKAESEIDHASKQLRLREESLLELLEQAEAAEKEAGASAQKLEALQKSQASLLEEAKEKIALFRVRRVEEQACREEFAKRIEPAVLSVYDRMQQRFPTDAVAMVKEGTCSGCYMQVAPQLMLQIARGDSLVKCRGCGRILYVQPGEESEKSREE